MGGKGKVAVLGGNQNAPNLQKRVQGVLEEAKKHPGITVLNTFYHAETPRTRPRRCCASRTRIPTCRAGR
jgi:ribose transport system substrate-binding protein